jgi:hypothetical protein
VVPLQPVQGQPTGDLALTFIKSTPAASFYTGAAMPK